MRVRVPITPSVAAYDHFLLDLDGCLWLGDGALPGAVDAVAALREAGKSILFLTNDVRHAPEAFVRKLWRLGFQASLDEIVTVGAAVQFALTHKSHDVFMRDPGSLVHLLVRGKNLPSASAVAD